MDESTHRTQRRRPTIAKEWQLAVLKKLQSESGNPTEAQRSAAAVETGLDEKWVKSWFTRQRLKDATRNKKSHLAGHSATVSRFKLQLTQDNFKSSRRSTSTPIPSPACLESPSPSTVTTTHSQHGVSPTLVPAHTSTMPTYSRDPLCNRYPDFSQFFRPQVCERFHIFELAPSSNNHNHVSNVGRHTSLRFQGFLDPLHPFIDTRPLASLPPCPVAFSMRAMDLLSHSSVTRYPAFPVPELE